MLLHTVFSAGLGLAFSAALAAADGPSVEFHNGSGVLPPNLPFSEAVRVGDLVFLSGQIGIAPGGMKLVQGGLAAEAKQTMDNIRKVLTSNGYAMADLVKCTVMLADMADWPAFNEIYKSYFQGRYPARSAFATNGLALGARVEVECIAAAGTRTDSKK